MPDIGDQFSEKTVALAIKAIKLDAKLLAKAIGKLLKDGQKLQKKLTTPKDMTGKGQQTVKQIVRQGQGVYHLLETIPFKQMVGVKVWKFASARQTRLTRC